MMLEGIVPGHGRKEPKSLDPYLKVLVEELLSNMECNMYDSYKEAPVDVKIALLQYLCDIPAFSKLLYCSGQAALRSCMFCKDVGVRCPELSKVIHLSNRQFLSEDSPLRQDNKQFALKLKVNDPKPGIYTKGEEMTIRAEFDQKPNKNQKSKLQNETGFKGIHPLHSLPYFDSSSQMQTDGMHTISNIIGNVLDLISSKTDGTKVRKCEKMYNRFKQTWLPNTGRKRKANDSNSSQEEEPVTKTLPEAPWSLNKAKLKTADSRAMSIKYPKGFDYTPADHFSRQWTLRTMHGKQQFVIHNVAAWCLRGLLGKQQEDTLNNLFTVIKRLVQPQIERHDIEQLKEDSSIAVSLLERDFPLTLQNLNTHLLHHFPEGFADFGPLYDRWLYPLERANSWITRQILQHGNEESLVMQTYRIYDWSSFNLPSGAVKIESAKTSSLSKAAHKILGSLDTDCVQVEKSTKKKPLLLTSDEIKVLHLKYCELFGSCGELADIDPIVYTSAFVHRFTKTTQRNVYFSTVGNQTTSRSCDSIVFLKRDNLFGQITKILKHSFKESDHTWFLLNIFPPATKSGQFHFTANNTVMSKLVYFKDVSDPLVTATCDNSLWFISNAVIG